MDTPSDDRGTMFKRLLIANRGEIAIRISRAAGELGIATVSVFSEDDAGSLHVRRADDAQALRGTGAAAYLDVEQIIAAAVAQGCDAIHPGYGFLSEHAGFARASAAAGITFVGPSPEVLDAFGDKVRARGIAERAGVPVLPGSRTAVTADEARAFLGSLAAGRAMVIKAVAGGGGRGMRMVARPGDVEEAYERCRSEAQSAFASSELYVEEFLPRVRHVEVQVAGDGSGEVSHFWERDCTLQRRHQKLIEIAPAPFIAPAVRERLLGAAVAIARAVRFGSIGTVEFLVEGDGAAARLFFIEANARLQVEHTVTEEVTGIDLVKLQIQLAAGRSLAGLGLAQREVPAPRGFAVQARVNMETMREDGTAVPAGGRITAFEPPSGPGIRVDSFAYAGYQTSTNFDALLAKVIAHAPGGGIAAALGRARRALGELLIEGVATNTAFLQALLRRPELETGDIYTGYIEGELAGLVREAGAFEPAAAPGRDPRRDRAGGLAGVRLDAGDPLAVLHYGKTPGAGGEAAGFPGEDGLSAVRAPIQGTVIALDVAEGDDVRAGQRLLVMEAMKMEHVIVADVSGRVAKVAVAVGDAVYEGHALALIEEGAGGGAGDAVEAAPNPAQIRPDLAEVKARHAVGLDEARPEAVARRRRTKQRTARENIADLCDEGSFVEYGPLTIAAQRRRRPVEELITQTPADGLVAGIGAVNGDLVGEAAARCIAMSYDYTVLAGTQGAQNHRKKDRMFELAEKWRLPIVFFTEGGGGRPGDTDGLGVAGLDCMAFHYFGRLSGLVPLVGITSGRCFAGNAALLGCCDVVIATEGSNIGMGGPAMIEGGGLGVFRPEEVGPLPVQARNGVVDVPVADEAEAVRAAKRYLSYFQGAVARWECADQRLLRATIPENRRRIYDVRKVIETMADAGSVLELRRQFGAGMVTALARIEGRPVGVIANNPSHLAGAIDSDGADKATRFMQLCDAFDIPLLSLCDTPGIMVGPEVEKTALVRHASRMFVTGASVTVPFFTIVLRKGYGLGAQAMAGGSFKAPMFTVAWPTGEFGGMGLEGAVKLGYRNELAAIEEPERRTALYEEMVERMYERGKAVNTASHFEIDDVIDPADSRRWIAAALRAAPPPAPRTAKKRPCIDTW